MIKPYLKILTSILILSLHLTAGTFEPIRDFFISELPDSNTEQGKIDYAVSHQELLRESRLDTLLSRNTIRTQALNVQFPIERTWFLASWSRNVPRLSDLFESDYLTTSFQPSFHQFELSCQTQYRGWTLNPGITYSFIEYSDTLHILSYPYSDVSAMNTYFYDLLPATFGSDIPYRDQYNRIGVNFSMDKHSMFVQADVNTGWNTLLESHLNNTSSNIKLSGPRESMIGLKSYDMEITGGWHKDQTTTLWGGFRYSSLPFDWHHTEFPDEPDTTEIVQLGNGKNRISTIHLSYKEYVSGLQIQFSALGGFASCRDTARTPVLGYAWFILPISHQADMAASSIFFGGYLHADYKIHWGNSYFIPRINVLALRVYTDLSFNALLEFGLEDVQFEEHYVHAAYLSSLGCYANIAINQDLYLTFDAEQLIPYIKTVSPEQPSPQPSDIKRYGGLSLSAGIFMSW